ncbi:MAG: 5-dehydro-4-deoxy-D-glucuronate isomerase [Gammaproteobacteria bacterium]|jgi:4-deoxy-L-threo-5-hexosulose-uronate ketol-isomerase|nr:5-dehydro-4-deoxy-D-glucuronate isomerase [Gammaproteobacteria bacterium]
MEFLFAADRERYRRMTTSELREAYMVDGMFIPGDVTLCYTDIDRAIVGSAVPLEDSLTLPVHKELASDFFAQRREIGVINIGGSGKVTVDGETYDMENRDSLYIGRGSKDVEFRSNSKDSPAQFYILSYPAHAKYPTKLVKQSEAKRMDLGSTEECNERIIHQSIRPGIVDTCQIVMGFTQLAPGSIWNTMPPHTHRRRTEVYMYFDLDESSNVFHFMGEPDETRSLVVRNGEAVVSPSWSLHCAAGTRNYTFIWGMGGENQEFDDMDHIDMKTLR